MKNWDNLKEQNLNLFTSESFLAWLSLVAEDLTENENLINDLESEKEQDSEQLTKLQEQLIIAQKEGKEELTKQLEQQIHELEQEKNGEEAKLAKIRQENTFLYQQLNTISQSNFLTTRKEQAIKNDDENESIILTELEHVVESKSTEINDLKTRLLTNHTKSSVLRRSSVVNQEMQRKSSYTNSESEIPEENSSHSQKPIEQTELYQFLITLDKKWNDHLSGVKLNDYYSGQEELLHELIKFIESALHSPADLTHWANDLLTKWQSDPELSKWQDLSLDRYWLAVHLKYHNESDSDEEESNKKSEELKLEIEDLKIRLEAAQKDAEIKTQNWKEASTKFTQGLAEAIAKKEAEYQNFINPNDKKKIKLAGLKIGLKTKAELDKAVAKVQEILTTWTTAFPNSTPEQVKVQQEQLIKEKEELSAKLTEAQEKVVSANKERDEWRLRGKRAEKSSLRNEEENVKMTKENQEYASLYNELVIENARNKSELKKVLDRIRDLEEQLANSNDSDEEASETENSAKDNVSENFQEEVASTSEENNSGQEVQEAGEQQITQVEMPTD